MKSIEAVESILREDPRTREQQYTWLFLIQTLRELGFRVYINFDRKMPSPETLLRERREILNKKNRYGDEFIPEPGVTIERPKEYKGD